ncbi:B12-binding domain-containing radical SAM protein [Thermaerobacter subterraneus]|uniref:Fe-S oxidoreductase n=1 Tax=Thermaerobacter subterraneus DSM 13965 TaxID=867903 RepID=K6Q3F5_9FIRM|nr:cobalamin-dependent protein [Thermaerobacter subterraneus]EKP95594.1 Fe-S oxidoreductase [Thermaerobacter subterraneus DSM 13965]
MRALYIHPGMNGRSSMYAIMPMGAVALVNLLRERGWSVCGVNAAMERSLSSSFDLARFLASLPRQDLVLIDLHWYMHTAGAFEAASLARTLWEDSIVVVGGMTASIFAEDVLRLCPSIDVVIRGDAEDAVLQLAELACHGDRDFARIPNAVYWNDNTICRSPRLAATSPTLFNELDFVTIDWLHNWQAYYKTGISGYSPMQKSRYWLETARGCFYNCIMCGGGQSVHENLCGLRRPLFRDVGRILSDIERLYELGVEQVAFSHDIFTLPFPGREDLLRGLLARGLKVGLYHEFWRLTATFVISQLHTVFDAERSDIAISPESGCEVVRKRNFPSKFFKNEELLELLRTLSKATFELQVFFAANLPWETETTWQETLRLTRDIVSVYGCDRLTLYAGFITIDPMSPMWLNPDTYNIHRYFSGLSDYWRMTNEGVRRPGYESEELTIAGVRRNLERFREVAISMRKAQV